VAAVPADEALTLRLVGAESADLPVLVLDAIQRVEAIPLVAQRTQEQCLALQLLPSVQCQEVFALSDNLGALFLGQHSGVTSASSSSSDLPTPSLPSSSSP